MDDKQIKAQYEAVFSEQPHKYFPTEAFAEEGFVRQQCQSCGRYFWTVDAERQACGEAACYGKYTFLETPIAQKSYSYVDMWQQFAKILKQHGYTPITRYPVSARWRQDIHFVEASIDDFIPHVVSGAVAPPANPLVVPQPCLRFNDIENIGITGEHYSLFTMVGQHAFAQPDTYDQNAYFRHLLRWFTKGLGMDTADIVLHEDVWAGSGNFGPCIEFFSGGVELCNQVYMQFRNTGTEPQQYTDLRLKVLDMGLGHERNVWFSQGTATSYDAVFPGIISQLRQRAGLSYDANVVKQFVPYAGLLNIDEVPNLQQQWQAIAQTIDIDANTLQQQIMPLSQLYSIADHARAVLFAIADGTLPSNTGGGHNVRIVLRRASDFLREHDIDIALADIVAWHAQELQPLFPELRERLADVQEVVSYEEEQYQQRRADMSKTLGRLSQVDTGTAIELYESHGITPEMLERHGFAIPDDFYTRLTARHTQEETTDADTDIELPTDVPATERLYWQDAYQQSFSAQVLHVTEHGNNYLVILDKTAFYPTSGGQQHDTGVLRSSEKEVAVTDVFTVGNVIVHVVTDSLEEGVNVDGLIDWGRRKQHMQHHTATHIVNGAAVDVLGRHVWQAGAEKTIEKGRLDITHYKHLSAEDISHIEQTANALVREDRAVKIQFMERNEAEQELGFRIYQGGAVPGDTLRIVKIPAFDVEACSGTHCRSTGEVDGIRITRTQKIQDGVIRLEYVAGNALHAYRDAYQSLQQEIQHIFEVDTADIEQLCALYSVERETLLQTLQRFKQEWEEQHSYIRQLESALGKKQSTASLPGPVELFDAWKQQQKYIDQLLTEYKAHLVAQLQHNDVVKAISKDVAFLMDVLEQSGRENAIVFGDDCAVATPSRYDHLASLCAKVVEKEDCVLGFGLQKKDR